MIKNFIWEKSTEIISEEEKYAFIKSMHNTTLDMEIDLDRIDKREKEAVNCYKSFFTLSQEEYDGLSDVILLDFGENVYIGRDMLFINGKQVGYTYVAGAEQKYTASKSILKPGQNYAFVVVEYASGTNIWEDGKVITARPEGYTTEIEALPKKVTFYNYDKELFVSDIKTEEHGVMLRFADDSKMRITLYENGVYRFKYPYDFINIMDEMCIGELEENLARVKPVKTDISETEAVIYTEYNTIKIYFSPFAVEIYDKSGKCIYKNKGIVFSKNDVSLMEIELEENEHIFGLGENTLPTLDKRGRVEDIWVVHEAEKSDIPVPYYISTNGYGFYLNTACHSIFDMGNAVNDKALVYVYDNEIDAFFINGPGIENVISSYAKITGVAPMPPKWAFGFWQAGIGVCTQEGAEDTIDKYKVYDIPLDVMCIDPGWQKGSHCDLEWSSETFPEKDAFTDRLKKEQINLILWMVPFVNSLAESYKYHIENKSGLLNDKGDTYPVIYWKGRDSVALDFCNNKATDWLDGKIEKLAKDGISGLKTDGGDAAEIPFDVRNINGLDGKKLHNLYPLYFVTAVRKLLNKHIPGKRVVTWQRSSYVGCGKYPCHWGGDQLAEFKHLKSLLKAGQACGLMNVPFWSQDIGGFCLTPRTDEEFFIRSYEWGVLAPLARAHGGKTEPWAYGERALEITKKYVRLRYSLMPYIYSNAYEAHLYARPVMAPLFYYNFDDEKTYSRDYQYYYGKSLMIAPAYKAGGKDDLSCDVEIYFPKGKWLDLWTSKTYSGGETIIYNAAIDVLPMFVKIGSIIPFASEITNTKKYNPENLTVKFYPSEEETEFLFYDDDGESFDYRNGKYNVVKFCCINENGEIKITVDTVKDSYNKNYTGNYRFEVYSETEPSVVKVNGEKISASYNKETRMTIFDYKYFTK